eukprot:jgi/Chrpa1/20962/Chrysochromulina_OHIO_Genome00026493-RA
MCNLRPMDAAAQKVAAEPARYHALKTARVPAACSQRFSKVRPRAFQFVQLPVRTAGNHP